MPTLLQTTEPPDRLLAYLESGAGNHALRVRAVLNKSAAGPWQLICCVVTAYPHPDQSPPPVATRRYATTILREDWLEPAALRSLVDAIESGEVAFGDVVVERKTAPSWQLERVPLSNDFMRHPGYVARAAFDANVWLSPDPLISRHAPYYPDQGEAARDWLGLVTYHGHNDTRNGSFNFLLPEARAVFIRAVSDRDTLSLTIGGVQHAELALYVTGAYWDNGTIHHFCGPISNGEGAFPVPSHVRRLDYVLIDDNGEVFDHQYEGPFGYSGLVRERQGAEGDRLAQLVHHACTAGEGARVEFKPFIDFREGLGAQGRKTKYRELVRTAVALANTDGGCVFLGIDDVCNAVGVNEALRIFGEAGLSDALFESYRGALLNVMRGDIVGEVAIQISPITINDALIAVIEIQPAISVPVLVRGESIYYLRVGASNKQLAPNEWASTFGARGDRELVLSRHSYGIDE